MPLARTPAILNLLDGPVGIDPAFHIIWARFRVVRRYLASGPEKEPRIFGMLDLISRGAQGHGPVHPMLTPAAEAGFAWDGEDKGWVPPLRMMSGPIQHFYASILDAWRESFFLPNYTRGRFFFGAEFVDFKGSLQLLDSSHLRER